MGMSKKALFALGITSLFIGMVLGSIAYDYFLKPKIDYSLEENAFVAAYTETPLDFGTLWLNTNYQYQEYNETAPAIQVKRDANITVGLGYINTDHFTEFIVEIWNLTATPDTLVGSFDLTSPYFWFISGAADYGYNFYFTTAADKPGESGQIELEVYFYGL